MSIEEKLRQEYLQESRRLETFPSLDRHVLDIYRKEMKKNRGMVDMARRTKLPKIAAVLLIVGLLSGFAYVGGKLLFQENQGPWRVEARTSGDNFTLQHISAEQIRSKMAEVKSTLAAGEAAVIYFADLEKEANPLLRQVPMVGVSQPELVSDWNQWQGRLQEHDISVPVPQVIAGQFTFEAGQLGSPLVGDLDKEGLRMLDQLKQESQDTGNSIVWQKVQGYNPVLETYSYTYHSEAGERLFVTLVEAPAEKISMKLTLPDSTAYEEVSIHGVKAHYTSHSQMFYSESNQYQELFWTQTYGEHSYMVKVGSDSPNITKAQLIQAAESIQ
ncbi:hypothetical protein BVG16_09010 [Paenibacillus selenitireducens]|uniref:DUF4367 domain-containing protein n=1 Tax=Paenibacillus selenitireducens TaxID=1324314 RepID=A0A1T2XH63_9BACL|nr:hypothetical protein [Paenibacillus selenitireducens]OPA79221.1 hypothetical protein BVG16_09010 [Paenibacillus selenitireducens]